ncbi:uncharacterized protein PAC_08145 [Phialocephala subalpina]|uniref:DRBM domain-containing protein n=1 Tax=Phialocephala subalpina TaxID=576137 RepID=A0A1L7WZR8_9HELO|nr:uncharacterized protein PAC_08145 [Phialocephala subalpina]
MGTFHLPTRSLKPNLLKFFGNLSIGRSSKRTVAEIFLEESSNSYSSVHPINKISELPSGDIMATSLSCSTGEVFEGPVVIQDRWLGLKILEFAIANVTLRSISPNASESELQDLSESLIRSFRFEECFRALCSPSKPPSPGPSFRDLLLGQVGHINRQNQGLSSAELFEVLENFVDDPRRHQNEKYIIQDESNLDHTPKAGSLLDRTPSPPSPPQKDTQTLQGEANNNGPALPIYITKIQEYGAKQGLRPKYDYETVKLNPERFLCTVTLGELEARGIECGSKKSARHEASKALWELSRSIPNGQ